MKKLLVILMFFLLPVFAEALILEGRVSSRKNGDAVSGARVILSLAGQKVTETSTDEHGYFRMKSVMIGVYDLLISKNGFHSLRESNIKLINNSSKKYILIPFKNISVESRAISNDSPLFVADDCGIFAQSWVFQRAIGVYGMSQDLIFFDGFPLVHSKGVVIPSDLLDSSLLEREKVRSDGVLLQRSLKIPARWGGSATLSLDRGVGLEFFGHPTAYSGFRINGTSLLPISQWLAGGFNNKIFSSFYVKEASAVRWGGLILYRSEEERIAEQNGENLVLGVVRHSSSLSALKSESRFTLNMWDRVYLREETSWSTGTNVQVVSAQDSVRKELRGDLYHTIWLGSRQTWELSGALSWQYWPEVREINTNLLMSSSNTVLPDSYIFIYNSSNINLWDSSLSLSKLFLAKPLLIKPSVKLAYDSFFRTFYIDGGFKIKLQKDRESKIVLDLQYKHLTHKDPDVFLYRQTNELSGKFRVSSLMQWRWNSWLQSGLAGYGDFYSKPLTAFFFTNGNMFLRVGGSSQFEVGYGLFFKIDDGHFPLVLSLDISGVQKKIRYQDSLGLNNTRYLDYLTAEAKEYLTFLQISDSEPPVGVWVDNGSVDYIIQPGILWRLNPFWRFELKYNFISRRLEQLQYKPKLEFELRWKGQIFGILSDFYVGNPDENYFRLGLDVYL